MEIIEQLDGQRILVTGATGSLGRQVILELLARGLAPIAMVRVSSDTAWLEQREVPIRRADLRDKAAVHEAVRGVDAVIHTAAWVSFRGDRLTQFTGINVFGAVGLYGAAKAHGVKRFVHVSSVAAVGGRLRRTATDHAPELSNEPLTEAAEWNLEHLRVPYIQSKHAAEHELRSRATGDAPALVIVNPSIMITEKPSLSRRKQFSRFLERRMMIGLPTRLNLVDVRDCAPAILAALARGAAGKRYILAGENIGAGELVAYLDRLGKKSPRLVPVPRRLLTVSAGIAAFWTKLAGRARLSLYPDLVRLADYDWVYSSERARAELGFRSRPLSDSLRDVWVGEFLDRR